MLKIIEYVNDSAVNKYFLTGLAIISGLIYKVLNSSKDFIDHQICQRAGKAGAWTFPSA